MSTTVQPKVHPPGRRTLRTGIAMVVVAALAIGASIVSWLAFNGSGNDGAVVFEMPGSVTADLTEGEWAIYSEEVGGSQKVAYGGDVTVDGPAEVTPEQTFGFYADDQTIEVDGTSYTVFMRMTIPTAGSYDVTVADDATEAGTPVVLGHYDEDDALAWFVLIVFLGGFLLAAAGVVTAIVGLVLGVRGRRRAAA